MGTSEQNRANKANSSRSTGPKRTENTRFNGLKHGLRAEQLILPGEDPDALDAELQGWRDDWSPRTQTAAALCERAAAANWKLRRATRVEAAKLRGLADAADDDFEDVRRNAITAGTFQLPRDPGYGLAYLTRGPLGYDTLIAMWQALVEAAAAPSGWTSHEEHHERLLNLLGHRPGFEPEGLAIARQSQAVLSAHESGAAADALALAAVRSACAEGLAEVRRKRSGYSDPEVYRQRAVDAACAPVTKELQLMHRYEMAHENALFRSIRQLMALSKAEADAPEESEPAPEAVPTPPAAAVAAPAAAAVPGKPDTKHGVSMSSGKLASVGAATSSGPRSGRPEAPAGRSDRPGRPSGPARGRKKPRKRS